MMSQYIEGGEITGTYRHWNNDTGVVIREYEVEIDLPHGLGDIALDRQELEELLASAKAKESSAQTSGS